MLRVLLLSPGGRSPDATTQCVRGHARSAVRVLSIEPVLVGGNGRLEAACWAVHVLFSGAMPGYRRRRARHATLPTRTRSTLCGPVPRCGSSREPAHGDQLFTRARAAAPRAAQLLRRA